MKRLRLLSLLVLLMTAATGAWADDWTDIIINGDLDGSDRQCFFERENSISSSAIFYAKIRDGIGVDGSRCIMVQSDGNEENDWDTQFYIRLPYELPTGTPFRLSFDYKATKSADCDLQSHNEPGEYIHWGTGAPTNFTFGNGWSTFTANNGTVPEECDGQLHGSLYHNFQTLAFSLAKNREATTFYFDNIKFEIPTSVLSELTPKPVTDVMPQYPVEITSMAIMGDFLGQGEVNNWNPTNGWALTQDNSNPAIWKLTREFTAVARTYEYKIFANGNMDDFTLPVPADDKGQFVISEAGDYTLTVTVDTEAGTASVTADVPGSSTLLTLGANDPTMGSVNMGGESKIEWTPTTWSGWNSGENFQMTKSDSGITMAFTTSSYYDSMIKEDDSSHGLWFFVNETLNDCSVTFSSDEDNFSRIELLMQSDYSETQIPNPHIRPLDGWTFEGKSAVWEGTPTNSLVLTSCSTTVDKITFYKDGGIPEGVTVNGDGTFTVTKRVTVKVKATPEEGFILTGWSDAPDCTDLVREISIEPGQEDNMTITAIFEEMTYTATFVAANDNTIEAGKATVKVDNVQKTLTDGKLTDLKKTNEVKLNTATGYKLKKVEVKKGGAAAAKTITIGDMELTYADGDKWETIVSKNSDKIKIVSNMIVQVAQPAPNQYRYIHVWYTAVKPSDIIDPSKNYQWDTMEVYY